MTFRLVVQFVGHTGKEGAKAFHKTVDITLKPGQKVIVIEDLISTGKSSLKAAEAIRLSGAEVVGMVAMFTYGFPVAEKAFAEAGIRLMTLSNYEAMLDVALETGFIRDKDIKTLQQWREDPGNWTPANRNIE